MRVLAATLGQMSEDDIISLAALEGTADVIVAGYQDEL